MTDPAPTISTTLVPRSSGAPVTSRRAHAGARTVRRVVRHIEPRSVLRVSLLFYGCVGVALLAVGVVVWLAAAALGVVGHVETFIGDLFALEHFHFEPLRILLVSILAGAVLVLLGTGLNVLAVVLYNRVADRVGGVDVTIIDDERPHSVV